MTKEEKEMAKEEELVKNAKREVAGSIATLFGFVVSHSEADFFLENLERMVGDEDKDEQIERLKEENEKLKEENEKLLDNWRTMGKAIRDFEGIDF